ncbi:hypothetical protein IHQ71_11630 [Rhizobium sp. TH2]|uniref:hypothetical protein n=1 Tax=Rhizobium sp. TH2 TaxID=2775403 RepID=UPI0021574DC5|nr:hypothetical protein [Rhizobium sp. TH2]UVC12149.1 hypothetical protein IHQ71_11630 [Rhizobium sp. TH2]
MRIQIEVNGPDFSPSDPRRTTQCQQEATVVARQVISQFVQSGWRESEAALALADAFDDYCMYLAEKPKRVVLPANSNRSAA